MINTSHGKSVGKYHMVIRVKEPFRSPKESLKITKDPYEAFDEGQTKQNLR